MVDTRSSEARSDDTLLRVEGLEKAVTELNAKFDAKFDTLLQEIRASRTNVQQPQHPPHTEDDDASAAAEASDPPIGSPHPMALPSFDGTDALGWLARAGQYFMVNKTPDTHRLDLALIALSGSALPWVQILRRRYPALSWDRFAHELIIRFGDEMTRDGYEALAATRHDGSLADYIAAFKSHLAQLPDMTDNQFMGFFLANLKPSIWMQLRDPSITNYSDAVQMAKRCEKLSNPISYTAKAYAGSSPSTYRSSLQQSGPHAQAISRPSQTSVASSSTVTPRCRFRHMNADEYRKHMAEGTCFKCGLRCTPTHRCLPKTLQVLVDDDDDVFSEDEAVGVEEPSGEGNSNEHATIHQMQLSELSSQGLDSFQTMKLYGLIGSTRVKVMVDSGASHCFLSDKIAHSLGLEITPMAPFSVRLGDGSKVRSRGFCPAVRLQLASEAFRISCYVFPLSGVDIILGISWLASLGVVKAD